MDKKNKEILRKMNEQEVADIEEREKQNQKNEQKKEVNKKQKKVSFCSVI